MRSGSVLKRFIGAAMCGALVMAGISGCRIQYVEDETASEETTAGSMEEDRQVDINLWYSDEIYSDYLSMCAAQYENANKNVHINIEYIPETDYMSTLTSEAVKPGKVDLYLVDNDNLEQVKLAGIASENRLTDIYNVYNYSQTALNACTYNDKLIAYPLSYDTSFLIYNRDYVQDADMSNFEAIKLFAENLEVPAGSSISSVFTCDLKDIFYSYGYLGAYLDIGGKAGDDKTNIFNITTDLTKAAELYKQLIEYFYIDINSVD